jgi:hypothetical protein
VDDQKTGSIRIIEEVRKPLDIAARGSQNRNNLDISYGNAHDTCGYRSLE